MWKYVVIFLDISMTGDVWEAALTIIRGKWIQSTRNIWFKRAIKCEQKINSNGHNIYTFSC